MMKHLKIFFLSMAVVGLMAGSGFAGTTFINNGVAGGNFQVSLEAMGAARNVTIVGVAAGSNLVATAALGYTAAQALVATNLLTVTFTGAGFTGDPLNICAMNTNDVSVANATPTAGAANWNFQLGANATLTLAGAGGANSIYITKTACGVAAMNMPVQISATAAAVNPTVQITAQTSGGVLIDTSTAKRLATVAAEYSVVNNFQPIR